MDVQEIWQSTITLQVVKSNSVFINQEGGNKIW